MVIARIPFQSSEELDEPPLLAPSDELLQRAGDRSRFAAFATHRDGAFEQSGSIARFVAIVQTSAHHYPDEVAANKAVALTSDARATRPHRRLLRYE